ncbi:MFS transporter, DHA1 family, bicyclomycin/chloramphenicol resistance protein [Bradyrhizobium sp. NFR13]|uniref:multidrug effflux MFS transporter n=1 Tax=Bradyrhizobium sp. NFR13 TaxID=1566285 RepID=UPI0008EDC02F|nr:multidrug effflux MFS transporter [Bradyrhizobium sp. NFR13]SFL60869.1 MFS transporter, DHA1 family, bicyclomycin/chloramphenicol resistance protein [Bradyrhizobium sp. NFR13]
MALRRDSFAFTAFLGTLTALPPLSIDMGLPGLPAIEASFADAAGRGPLTLSLFLAGFAISPLICGPLADRFGRRATLLDGLLLFSIAAGACALAPSFTVLLVCRLIQGFAAGACAILPIAIVRDLFQHATARQKLSQIAAVLGIAPMMAPVLGGWVMAVSDWRSIYAVQAAVGLILLVVGGFGLAESQPVENRRSLNPQQLAESYRFVLGDRGFVGYALLYACAFACMFAFISGAPSVLIGSLGLSTTSFSLLFGLTSCGVLVASLISGQLSRRHIASRKIIAFGLIVMITSAVAALLLVPADAVTVATLIPPMALTIFAFGILAPSTNHEALANLPHVAGSAAGVMRCMQMVMGAFASAMIAVFEPFGHPALVMTGLMAGMALAAGAIYLWLLPKANSGQDHRA